MRGLPMFPTTFNYLWVSMCLFTLAFSLDRYGQCGHEYGFSPVWIRMWRLRCEGSLVWYEHSGQEKGLSSLLWLRQWSVKIVRFMEAKGHWGHWRILRLLVSVVLLQALVSPPPPPPPPPPPSDISLSLTSNTCGECLCLSQKSSRQCYLGYVL